jgi:hypothetical protein
METPIVKALESYFLPVVAPATPTGTSSQATATTETTSTENEWFTIEFPDKAKTVYDVRRKPGKATWEYRDKGVVKTLRNPDKRAFLNEKYPLNETATNENQPAPNEALTASRNRYIEYGSAKLAKISDTLLTLPSGLRRPLWERLGENGGALARLRDPATSEDEVVAFLKAVDQLEADVNAALVDNAKQSGPQPASKPGSTPEQPAPVKESQSGENQKNEPGGQGTNEPGDAGRGPDQSVETDTRESSSEVTGGDTKSTPKPSDSNESQGTSGEELSPSGETDLDESITETEDELPGEGQEGYNGQDAGTSEVKPESRRKPRSQDLRRYNDQEYNWSPSEGTVETVPQDETKKAPNATIIEALKKAKAALEAAKVDNKVTSEFTREFARLARSIADGVVYAKDVAKTWVKNINDWVNAQIKPKEKVNNCGLTQEDEEFIQSANAELIGETSAKDIINKATKLGPAENKALQTWAMAVVNRTFHVYPSSAEFADNPLIVGAYTYEDLVNLAYDTMTEAWATNTSGKANAEGTTAARTTYLYSAARRQLAALLAATGRSGGTDLTSTGQLQVEFVKRGFQLLEAQEIKGGLASLEDFADDIFNLLNSERHLNGKAPIARDQTSAKDLLVALNKERKVNQRRVNVGANGPLELRHFQIAKLVNEARSSEGLKTLATVNDIYEGIPLLIAMSAPPVEINSSADMEDSEGDTVEGMIEDPRGIAID